MYDRQVRKADDVSSQIACDIVRHADDDRGSQLILAIPGMHTRSNAHGQQNRKDCDEAGDAKSVDELNHRTQEALTDVVMNVNTSDGAGPLPPPSGEAF